MDKPIIFYIRDTMFAVSPSSLVMLVIIAAVIVGGIAACVGYFLARS